MRLDSIRAEWEQASAEAAIGCRAMVAAKNRFEQIARDPTASTDTIRRAWQASLDAEYAFRDLTQVEKAAWFSYRCAKSRNIHERIPCVSG